LFTLKPTEGAVENKYPESTFPNIGALPKPLALSNISSQA
jgi:hypothetical protein